MGCQVLRSVLRSGLAGPGSGSGGSSSSSPDEVPCLKSRTPVLNLVRLLPRLHTHAVLAPTAPDQATQPLVAKVSTPSVHFPCSRLDRHWSHVVGGCIRSAPELSRRSPACHCGSRRCDEGRCRRCRPFDSCAPRMVGGAQQSTLRPLDRAAANLAAAGTMESCAMILRGVHPWGLARPSKRPSLGNFQLPFHNAACSCDQLLHGTSGSGRAAAGTIAESCVAQAGK